MTTENDIVLIYFEDQPAVFARVEAIDPDKKKNWYQIKLLFLQIPLSVVTWILKDAYIDGEPFTMGGKNVRLEKVESPEEQPQKPAEEISPESGDAKVIQFGRLKKDPHKKQ